MTQLRRGRRALVTVGLVVLAYLVPTWIQVAPPPDRFDEQFATNPGDPVLLMWTMRHGADALVSAPASVLDANIFHPLDDTLAYSDNLLAFAPVFGSASALLGGDPVAAYNATAIVTYLAGAMAVFALARWLFRSDAAAFVAGLVFTLAPYRSVMVAHIQLAGVAFVVLALLFTMRFLRGRRLVDAALAGVAVAGTWYSAQYYALAVALAVPTLVGVWMVQRWRRPSLVARPELDRRFVAGGAVFGAVVVVLVGVTLGPYLRLQESGLFERGPDEVLRAQWHFWRQLPPSWMWSNLANRECCQGDRGGYYPGLAVLVLLAVVAGSAIAGRVRRPGQRAGGEAGGGDEPTDDGEPARDRTRPDRWREFRLPFAIATFAFTPLLFGPGLEPQLAWEVATDAIPGLSSIRDTGRFWMFPLLGLAVLAGRGIQIGLRGRTARTALAVSAVVYLVVWADLVYAPPMTTIDQRAEATAAYRLLSTFEPGPVTELPVPNGNPSWPLVTAPRQLRSLEDGNPRLEGYSGVLPPTVVPVLRAGRAVPAPAAVAYLRSRGTRYLLLHGDPAPCLGGFGPEEMDVVVRGLAGSEDVSRIVAVPGSRDVIVELVPGAADAEPPPDLPAVARDAPYCPPPQLGN